MNQFLSLITHITLIGLIIAMTILLIYIYGPLIYKSNEYMMAKPLPDIRFEYTNIDSPVQLNPWGRLPEFVNVIHQNTLDSKKQVLNERDDEVLASTQKVNQYVGSRRIAELEY